MIPSSALIINHRILHTSGGKSGGESLTANSLQHSVDYPSRQGRFASRGGLEQTVTRDDLRLERLKDMVDYRARKGRFSERNEELPMAKGEVSGGCFDRSGLRDERELAQQILDSGSNLIKSIVSIPREYAVELNMTGKEDFQRVMRGGWDKMVQQWGIIRPSDVEWAAFFHTDNATNLHVHVLTWDRSGTFSGPQKIPQSKITTSKTPLQDIVFKDIKLQRDIDKDYLRNLSKAKLRVELGQSLKEDELTKLDDKLTQSSFDRCPIFLSREISQAQEAALIPLRQKVTAQLSLSCMGYTQTGSLTKEARAQIRLIQNRMMREVDGLTTARGLYKEKVEQGAATRGLYGKYLDNYVEKEMVDYDRRLSNVISRDIGDHSIIWDRDRHLSEDMAELKTRLSTSEIYVSKNTSERAIEELHHFGSLGQKTSYAAYFALEKARGTGELIEHFRQEAKTSIIKQTQREGRRLSEEDRKRIDKRIDIALKRDLRPLAERKLVDSIARKTGQQTERKVRQASWQRYSRDGKPYHVFLEPKASQQVDKYLKLAAKQGSRKLGAESIQKASNIVMNSTSIRNCIEREAICRAKRDGTTFETAVKTIYGEKTEKTQGLMMDEARRIEKDNLQTSMRTLAGWASLLGIIGTKKTTEYKRKRPKINRTLSRNL